MGGNGKLPNLQGQDLAMLAANPALATNFIGANKGLEWLRQPELARKKKMLRRKYEPEAESQALQARQMSIATGTVGGSGFSQETQAYEEIMRRLAQAMRAYEERLIQQQTGAIGTVAQVGGTVAGGIFGGPTGAAAGGAAGSQVGPFLASQQTRNYGEY